MSRPTQVQLIWERLVELGLRPLPAGREGRPKIERTQAEYDHRTYMKEKGLIPCRRCDLLTNGRPLCSECERELDTRRVLRRAG